MEMRWLVGGAHCRLQMGIVGRLPIRNSHHPPLVLSEWTVMRKRSGLDK